MKFFRGESNEAVMQVLRFAVGGIFLWFGVDKWVHPSAWFGWVPGWIWPILPVSPDMFMVFQGSFEMAIGVLLVAGKAVRAAAAFAGAFLLSVTLFIGVNDVTVRDGVILGACLALFLHADGASKRPLVGRRLPMITGAYIVFLFVTGILYLRSG